MRDLSSREREIVARLLAEQFAGNADLRRQVVACRVEQIDEDGSLRFEVSPENPRAGVIQRVPVQAAAPDSDGVLIHLDLHVVDGFLFELDIYREDEATVMRLPASDALDAFALPPAPSL